MLSTFLNSMTGPAKGPWEYYFYKVDFGDPSRCWNWKASVGGPGYGNWYHELDGFKKAGTAHRRAYALFFGHPGNLQINHKCGNRRCCNPNHLYAGTAKENHEDTIRHGRHVPPPRKIGNQVKNQYGQNRLTPDDVIEIRRLRESGISGRFLAAKYNISEDCVCKIYKRKNWAWLD